MNKMYNTVLIAFLLLLSQIVFAGAGPGDDHPVVNQISVTSTGGTSTSATYATLAAAITAINGGTIHTGTILCAVNAGYTETAPIGGFSITATGNASNSITFQKSGAGANPVFTAYTPQASGSINDAVFKIIGGDYITISGFTIKENAANTTTATATNNMTEFGIALFYASSTNGAQHNSILSNTISLNRTYLNTFGIYSNTRHTATSMTSTAEATSAAGANSFNMVYSNSISNVNYGIIFIGSAASSAVMDNGNDIGGTGFSTSNTITNWGNAAAASTYVSLTGSTYAIFGNHQYNNNVSYNVIVSAALSVPTATTGCISEKYTVGQPTGTISTTISNNTVTITNTATTGSMVVIDNQGLTALSSATVNITNNYVYNCAVSGASATSASFTGISNTSACGTLNLNNNIIRDFTSTATNGDYIGILNNGAVTTSENISANQVGNAVGNAVTFSNANSGSFFGIQNLSAATTCNTSIQFNDFRGIVYNTASASQQYILYNTATAFSSVISNNTFTNLSINVNAAVYLLYNYSNAPAGGAKIVQNNSIVGGFSRTGGGYGTYFYGYYDVSGSGAASTLTISGNNFSNISAGNILAEAAAFNFTGSNYNPTLSFYNNTAGNFTVNTAGTLFGAKLQYMGGSAGSPDLIYGNTFTNISATIGGASALYGLDVEQAVNANVYSNTINTLSNTSGSTYGFYTTANIASAVSVYGNTINTIAAGAGNAYGMYFGGGTTQTVYKNKIYDLASTAATSLVYGAYVPAANAATLKFYNNYIGDLRNPAATNTGSAVTGIYLAGTQPSTAENIYFNTVYLSASSSGANFSTAGIYHATSTTATTAALDLRNNIIVNKSTANGSGKTAAYRRSDATLTNYASASNNNLFYAGTPGVNNLIYYDGTNADQTLAAFQTRVSPRDALSVTQDPTFLSTTGSSASYLHIDPLSNSSAEDGGTPIPGITDDYDGDTRHPSVPDIGADEFIAYNVRVAATGGTLLANYLTLKAAFDNVNSGVHTGTVAVTIYTNTTETAAASLNASGTGSASYSALSIQPNGARTVSGNISSALVILSGADNVTIDGLNAGGNSLTLSNTATGSVSTITFTQDATNNTVRNCKILGSETDIYNGTISFTTGITTGNDNNTITGNTISSGVTPAKSAVYSYGSSPGINNSGITISNNNIADNFDPNGFSYSIYIFDNSSAWTITGNRFYQTSARTPLGNYAYGAILVNSGVGYDVSNNIIGYSTATGTGNTTFNGSYNYSFQGISLTAGTSVASSIQGNIISGFFLTTTGPSVASGPFSGISATGAVNIGNITGNIIGATSGTGSIVLTGGYGGALNNIYGIILTSTGTSLVQNNTIGSIDATGGDPGAGYVFCGIYEQGSAACTISANAIGNSTANNIAIGGLGTTIQATFNYGIYCAGTGNLNIGAAGARNTIQNIASNSSGGASFFYGIYNIGAAANLNISYNLFAGNSLAGVGQGTSYPSFFAIYNNAFITGALNITNNTVTSGTLSAPAYNSAAGYIYNSGAGAAAAVLISNNHFGGLNFTGSAGSTGYVWGIYNAAVPASLSITANEFLPMSLKCIRDVYLIKLSGNFNSPAVSNNFTTGTISKTASGGTFFGFGGSGTFSGGTATISNNNFSNIAVTGNTFFEGVSFTGSNSQVQQITGNTVSNITGGSNSVFGIEQSFGAAGSTVSANNVFSITGSGSMYGIAIADNGQGIHINCNGNKVYSLNTTGNDLEGIVDYFGNLDIFNNKIYDLQSGSPGAYVYGIYLPGTASSSDTRIYNNYVGDLRAPFANNNSAIYGISTVTGSANTYTVANNTVYLNTSSTGANFGTTAFYHSFAASATSPVLTLNNNLFINTSIAAGTGKTVAFYRGASTNISNYAAASGNNYLYAGTPSTTNVIFLEGSLPGYSTLAAFRYRVAPRDDKSVSDNPVFLSTVGSSANYLHIDPSVASRAESGGIPIAGITDDYDGDTRNGTAPDIGADEFNGILKDSTRPVITITTALDSCNAIRRIRATITDGTGIPLSGSLIPRIYYKKGAGAYQNIAGTFVSGTAANSAWDFIIDPAVLGATTGDAISYFIVAQDVITTVANIGSSPAAGLYAADVNTIIKDPTVLTTYTIGTIGTPYTWLGNNNNWFSPANWCGGAVPGPANNVVIPAGTLYYPLISSGTASANDISVAFGAAVTVNGTGIFSLNGAITNSGTFDLTNGTLDLSGSGSVSVGGNSILSNTVKNLTISKTASIAVGAGNTLKVSGFVSFLTSGNTLTTNGNLTLLSSAAGTASVTDITHNGATVLSGNSISGNASVERYISAQRKWNFISVNTNTSQTVQASWMEGQAPGTATSTGYGLWVTDAAPATNFDAVSFTPTMKWWNGSVYTGITDPTAYAMSSHNAYMTFVRGDRGSTSTNSILHTTVLRTFGTLVQNSPAPTAIPAGAIYTAVGNPYASAIDLTKLNYSTSGTINLAVWDPNLTGSQGLGAFQTFSASGPGQPFIISPGGGSYKTGGVPIAPGSIVDTIESGQAYFMQGTAGPRNVTFVETAKVGGARLVNFAPGTEQRIGGVLSLLSNGTATTMDGFMVRCNTNYNTAVDYDDARKFSNTGENVSVIRNNTLMSMEYRGLPDEDDTVFLNMSGMRAMNYEWNIYAANMDQPGRLGLLVDRLTGTETPLNLKRLNGI